MASFLFITANVGSIFEDPKGLLQIWVKKFLKTIDSLKPKFIALHCQEFGGKNYETSMKYVDEFVRCLLSSNELREFEHTRIFLDEDFSSSDKFTALGSFYFVHKTQDAYIWDFDEQIFVPAIGKEVHSGNIESVSLKHKMKFPQEFFPECKWSRKGFMKTRWLVNGIPLDLINIHLFHDESNFASVSDYPSVYAKNRRKALEYTLERNKCDTFKDMPLFIFGDFNFRLDTREVIKKLTNNCKPSRVQGKNGDLLKLIYRNNVNDRTLSVERKQFHYSDHNNFFGDQQNIAWLLEQDKELLHFDGVFIEPKIEFPPSYPFDEGTSSASLQYMNTRCPSWCDRILMNQSAKKLFDDTNINVKYEVMGLDVPMGDHKPVYFLFKTSPSSRERFCDHLEHLKVKLAPNNNSLRASMVENEGQIEYFDATKSSQLSRGVECAQVEAVERQSAGGQEVASEPVGFVSKPKLQTSDDSSYCATPTIDSIQSKCKRKNAKSSLISVGDCKRYLLCCIV